jgi:hypothetical protein
MARQPTGKGKIVKRQVLRIAATATIAAGGVLPLATPAQAHTLDLLSGTQVSAVIQVSVNVSGNMVAVGGSSGVNAQTGAKSASAESGTCVGFATLFGRTWI